MGAQMVAALLEETTERLLKDAEKWLPPPATRLPFRFVLCCGLTPCLVLRRLQAVRDLHVLNSGEAALLGQPLSPAPQQVLSRRILPLNRLCPEWHPEAHLTIQDHRTVQGRWPGPVRRLGQRLGGQLQRLRKPMRHLAVSPLLRAIHPRPLQMGLVDAPIDHVPPVIAEYDSLVLRLPVWWVRNAAGEVPHGVRELSADLRMPCYMLPQLHGSFVTGLNGGRHSAADLGAARLDPYLVQNIADLMGAMQPSGPFMLAGLGEACDGASQLACSLQDLGMDVTLVLVCNHDVGKSSNVRARDPESRAVEVAQLAHHLGAPVDATNQILECWRSGTQELAELYMMLASLEPPQAASASTWASAVCGMLEHRPEHEGEDALGPMPEELPAIFSGTTAAVVCRPRELTAHANPPHDEWELLEMPTSGLERYSHQPPRVRRLPRLSVSGIPSRSYAVAGCCDL